MIELFLISRVFSTRCSSRAGARAVEPRALQPRMIGLSVRSPSNSSAPDVLTSSPRTRPKEIVALEEVILRVRSEATDRSRSVPRFPNFRPISKTCPP